MVSSIPAGSCTTIEPQRPAMIEMFPAQLSCCSRCVVVGKNAFGPFGGVVVPLLSFGHAVEDAAGRFDGLSSFLFLLAPLLFVFFAPLFPIVGYALSCAPAGKC